jgi:hypothetical protein
MGYVYKEQTGVDIGDTVVLSGIGFTQLATDTPDVHLFAFLMRTVLDYANPVPALQFDMQNRGNPEVLWPPVAVTFDALCMLVAQIETTMELCGRGLEFGESVEQHMFSLRSEFPGSGGLGDYKCAECGAPGVMDRPTGTVQLIGGHGLTCSRRNSQVNGEGQ